MSTKDSADRVEGEEGVAASAPTRTAPVTHSSPGPARERVELGLGLGQMVGIYSIRRLLGEGGMGRVYLARDTNLGRSVALKIVSAAASAGRVLQEAQAIAKLNHPNIVLLYNWSEHEHGIYLVLEYIDGDTLRERIVDAQVGRVRIGIDEALRYLHAIADALAHAHAAGVLHCDLKPSNVMIGRDGRVKVVDFGIARGAGDLADSSGTVDWMAPEQWSTAPLTGAVDVWSLAIVAHQLLTGQHPFGDDPARRRAAACDPSRSSMPVGDRRIPEPIALLIRRSLAYDPLQRPRAADWMRTLDDVLNGRGDALTTDTPYPGLAAFDEQLARCYFGREREVDEFLERLRDSPHLPIVGPSGAGKSSFLHAGVIPRLRARERWTVIAFRPGSDPVGALARHVVLQTYRSTDVVDADAQRAHRKIKKEIQTFRAALLEHPALLAARLDTLAATHQSKVLLAVDQLEEAFTQCGSEHERRCFLTMLLGAADDPLDPVRVVFTVRDDFLGKITVRGDRTISLRSLFIVQKLGTADLRRTITAPLARHHYEFDDPAIVDELIAAVGTAEAADLPLLQFACCTLWERRDPATRTLRRATYDEMGGLAGALAKHAELALAKLSPEEHRTARQLLLMLVAKTTRRPVAREQLIAEVGPGAEAVIERLLQARLLSLRSQGDDSAIVEIAHESLLQTWSQLARWIDESRDERRLLDELEEATALWQRRGRRAEATLPHEDLVASRHRADQLQLVLPPHVQAFLTACEARHRLERRKRRLHGTALAMAAVVVMMIAVWIYASLQRERYIRANAGLAELKFSAFDLNDGERKPVNIADLPEFTWAVFASKSQNPHIPGEQYRDDDFVVVLGSQPDGMNRIDTIRTHGGTVFLRIDGRGRNHEHCAASWIRIQAFPGYGGDQEAKHFQIDVPTCEASRAGMLPIEAGPFIYGGPGEPPSRFYGELDYTAPETEVYLSAFSMDRTEVSNAEFSTFGQLEQVTGYAPPTYYTSDPTHVHDGDWDIPVTNIDAFKAAAFCAYMGKRLPGDYEWVKAVRGGRKIGGVVNPSPRRQYPWGTEPSPTCVNQAGKEDGAPWTAPVGSYVCGAGPYGHLNLAGNVDEWIARDKQIDATFAALYAVRGGSAVSPPERDHISVSFRNHRDPARPDYAVGFRCVADD